MEDTKVVLSEKNKDFFETKIKPLLLYVGTFGAIIMIIAYIVLISILIFGFKSEISLKKTLIISLINAIVGTFVMFFLKMQGKDFAKNLKSNKTIVKEYYKHKTKNKKLRSMKFFWIKSTITDVIVKGIFAFASSFLIVKLVVKGGEDPVLLGLAVVNILMFICFGLVALVKAYDYFNEYHVPYMINELKNEGIELKIEQKNAIINEENKEENPNANRENLS